MSPMSYSEIISRCLDDPSFFLALLCWVSFFMGACFSLGTQFIRYLIHKFRR